MGSIEVDEQQQNFDVENTIFVAVGTNVDESETTLVWAVQNFAGKKICVLHVHQPVHEVASKNEEPSTNALNEHVAKPFLELERKKFLELLDGYFTTLTKLGAQAQKVWIERNNVERGIVEIIAQYNIRWLVMGFKAERYDMKFTGLKSTKASFVCQQAPLCCHIWFVCRGHLMYSRGGGMDRFGTPVFYPLLLQNSNVGASQSDHPRPQFPSLSHKLNFRDPQEKEIASFSGVVRKFDSVGLDSKCSNNGLLGTSGTIVLLRNEGEKDKVEPSCGVLEKAMITVHHLKWKEFEEEDTAMGAKVKAKSLEGLAMEEARKRKEIVDILEREKHEIEGMTNKRDELLKEFDKVQEQKLLLERQASEYECNVEELEEKIFVAVELLVSFKEKRDKVRIEHESAMKKLKHLKNMAKRELSSFRSAEMPTFSFMEINEATQNFNPTWKIGEGRHGSVYKGLLRHMDVAVKMLPSYGSHTQLKFQSEVEVLSRVRHPNLVPIIGVCPESRSIIFENFKNGSLEDHLACNGFNHPLPWQMRIRISADICSALIFLHYNEPCIVHGDLKPSKILLDANFVGKLGGLGISSLILQQENAASTCNISNENNAYMDPEAIETGSLTPESDIYSFGVTLLRILTGRTPSGIVKDVKCALDNEKICAVLDLSAGDWPSDLATQMAIVALRCCEKEKSDRPDLVSELWSVLEPMRTIASESLLGVKKHSGVPAHFSCPIFQEIMKDPLIAADGFTYEADAIRGWFKSGHDTSPMTNLKLEHCNLVPNHALLNAIQAWQHQL